MSQFLMGLIVGAGVVGIFFRAYVVDYLRGGQRA